MPHARRLQQPVNLRRADRQKFFLNRSGQRRPAPLVMFEPFAQRRLEQLAAQLVAGQPHRLEHGQQLVRIIGDFGAGPFANLAAQWTMQQSQGGFAMVTAVETKLVKNAALVWTTGSLITTVDFGQILAFGGQTHTQGFGNHEYESTYQQTPRPPPSPGNI
jgi:hypothetical protein